MSNVTKKKAQEQHYRVVYLVHTLNLPKITIVFSEEMDDLQFRLNTEIYKHFRVQSKERTSC